MILGRVSERFVMPSDCAGRVEGRSSYARLGLSVEASGGFVNPGWRGHMPLIVVNHSDVLIRIPVGTPLCQLLVVGLAETPEADYAMRTDRKYQNDQGGPSYWWRDKIMRQIRESLGAAHIEHRVFGELDELLPDSTDDDYLWRLDSFVGNRAPRTYGSADELLTDFAQTEHRTQRLADAKLFIAKWIGWSAALAAGLAIATTTLSHLAKALIDVGLLAAAGSALSWALGREVGYYLTPKELTRLRNRRDEQRRRSRAP